MASLENKLKEAVQLNILNIVYGLDCMEYIATHPEVNIEWETHEASMATYAKPHCVVPGSIVLISP